MILNPVQRYYATKRQEAYEKAYEEAYEEEKLNIAEKLLEDGDSIEKISRITGLTKEGILKIK